MQENQLYIEGGERRWTGWIIDESLEDSAVLSKLDVLGEKTEENGEGDRRRVWKLYTVSVGDAAMGEVSKDLEKQIRPGYYTHFTSGEKLLVVFHGRSFVIRIRGTGEDKGFGIGSFEAEPGDLPIWESAFEYGTTEGKVDPRYIITVR